MSLSSRVIKKIANRRPILLRPKYVQNGEEFLNKTALIIGGGTGIGLAIAKELKNNGASVIVCGRKKYDLDGIISEVLDVSKIEELRNELERIINKYNRIDILVNSQGICPENDFRQEFYKIDRIDFESVFCINLESVFFTCQFFCDYFEKHNISGNVLNICSTEGLKGCVVPYGLSKAAIVSFTRGLGKNMASKSITINGIAPGATATNMMKIDMEGDLRRNLPSHRATIPFEIAKAAHLLLSDAGKQMCGEIVVVDGGESLH